MLTSGVKTFEFGRLRVQLYWPTMHFLRGDIYIKMETTLRLGCTDGYYNNTYYVAGLTFLGFGIGAEYE